MEKSINRTNYLSSTPLLFQEIEEGFDDWVRWLQSIKHTHEEILTARPINHQMCPMKELTDEEYDTNWQLNDEWHWLDDGGESGEVV